LTLPNLRVIAASAIRLHYMYLTIISNDPTLQGAFVSICTQIELNYCILANSLSCVGHFVSPFSKDTNTYYRDSRYPHRAKRSTDRSTNDYSLTSVNSLTSKTYCNKKDKISYLLTISLQVETKETTNGGNNNNNETSGSRNDQRHSFETNNSQRMIIQKKSTLTVEYDEEGAVGDRDKCTSKGVGGDCEGNVMNAPTEGIKISDIGSAV
jgi:hypothetical protein